MKHHIGPPKASYINAELWRAEIVAYIYRRAWHGAWRALSERALNRLTMSDDLPMRVGLYACHSLVGNFICTAPRQHRLHLTIYIDSF